MNAAVHRGGNRTASLALAILFLCGVACGATRSAAADALDDVLALIPPDAASFVVVPNLATVNADAESCIAAMDRKESVLVGRPIDQLRSALGITEGLDERGSLALWSSGTRSDEGRAFLLLLPAENPPAFIAANLAPAADGSASMRGERVFTRALQRHVLVARTKADIDGYDAKGGIGALWSSRVGARALELSRRGDAVAWAGADALAESRSSAEQQAKDAAGLGDFAQTFVAPAKIQTLLAGVESGVFVLDIDALGLSLRSVAVYAPESELQRLSKGSAPVAGGGGTLAGLPRSPFYLAAAIDAQALGGPGKLDELAAAVGADGVLPGWLAEAKEGVKSVRFACYPSKLGVLAGGLLNDCALLIETEQPAAIRDLFRTWLLAQTGKFEGVRREPAWEEGRTLKNGIVADAFELKETPLGASEAEGADLSGVAMRQLSRQALFGTRGMHGLVKVVPTGVVVTFSQRPDVLERAMKAAQGGDSLGGEPTLVAMRPWLVPGAQIEAFISVGQIVKVARQLADSFGGGDIPWPAIPARSPPIAVALRADERSSEAAIMIPTPTLAAAYDQALSSRLRGGAGGNADADASSDPNEAAGSKEAPNLKDGKGAKGSAGDGNDS
ncbi:MAG: hypothetical protein FJ256_06240 [Phycisphaerae bacterium]|nr:hypothetical protein [Phycisphaerae bacterium]